MGEALTETGPMRIRPWLILGALAVTLAAALDASALEGWLRSRDDGLAAAKKSGKPVLVITLWKDGV